MKIREAAIEDAESIARVHVDSWRATYRGIIPDAHLDSLSYEKRTVIWKENLSTEGEFTFVAEDADNGILGFASGGPERTGDTGYAGELYAIYLLEDCRRRGTGRMLVREIALILLRSGYPSMLAWVLAENPACAFYEALGGRITGRRTVTVGGKDLSETSYGWKDLRELAGMV